ncbi:hypothetical protein DIPPA_15272 [Diplonema papillatum]|nr:hypothetical protein DIPPA_15272 [Diplonema papillatum]
MEDVEAVDSEALEHAFRQRIVENYRLMVQASKEFKAGRVSEADAVMDALRQGLRELRRLRNDLVLDVFEAPDAEEPAAKRPRTLCPS